ncbi:SoxR reducing system RseC family protein [Thiohalorhabdus denitrificans]|uniref:Positive regulator of sigma(E), RseC/MucC n=1 Tax=Thiohalorhabdus denitrificans TaxID=381306 RepID=A0A1G5GUS3_9GAMM|nr:SoxR reducing system RseC family protein [Thiohalorhabdus denitrificans]SCY55296.1 positive regulator of sigma(E), RseC/MucC [Thiohalorhabdus denitrificans]
MIEAEATVVAVNDGEVEVEASTDGGGCGSCHSAGGCGGGRTILGTRPGAATRLRVAADLAVGPGDRVVVGLPEGGYLRASVALYLVPLLGMFGGAGIAEGVLGRLFSGGAPEILTLVAGLAGLGGGFLWQRGFGRRLASDPSRRPRIIRRAPGSEQPSTCRPLSSPGAGA